MKNRIMLGLWKYLLSIPSFVVDKKKQVERQKKKFKEHMGFMTSDHRRVHHHVVCELPRTGRPLAPKAIAQDLGMPPEKIARILQELEQHMTFLFRSPQGEVTWAYPVTVERTPHHLTFSTGEQVYAA